ncbi:MAG TPA: dienelactone hydrolase family protein [Thermogutta sp.]|nr:dienelactone hydrolase family protein [Thermogutta sp.]HPU05154.1 dienelactone hydrolase family protein [Thermogutta sp.]HPZ81895.1 dienelactone hydrolase family protein [Thermogutta sp.]HQF12770.1 dienelactone hydrolase family protein [Thermogutta sp.]
MKAPFGRCERSFDKSGDRRKGDLVWTVLWGLFLVWEAAVGFGQDVAPVHHVPWLGDVQMGLALGNDQNIPMNLLVRPDGSRIARAEQWRAYREGIRKWWLEFLKLPERDIHRSLATMQVMEKAETDGVVRCLIRYETPGNWPTEAFLLFPKDTNPLESNKTLLPAVIVFHSTTNDTIRQPAGLTAETTKAFGLQLAKRGYVTLCPRCYLWSDGPPYDYQAQVRRYQRSFPGSKGMGKMLADGMAAVDLLTQLPGVDGQRIGAIGHSLGGKEVLYLAAFDERIRATVSSEGGVGLSFSNWDAPWYLGPEIREPQFGHDHHELLALIAPRAFLLIGGDSADGEKSLPYLQSAWQVYRIYTERPALGLWNHRQGHSVPHEAEQRIAEWFDVYLREKVISPSTE